LANSLDCFGVLESGSSNNESVAVLLLPVAGLAVDGFGADWGPSNKLLVLAAGVALPNNDTPGESNKLFEGAVPKMSFGVDFTGPNNPSSTTGVAGLDGCMIVSTVSGAAFGEAAGCAVGFEGSAAVGFAAATSGVTTIGLLEEAADGTAENRSTVAADGLDDGFPDGTANRSPPNKSTTGVFAAGFEEEIANRSADAGLDTAAVAADGVASNKSITAAAAVVVVVVGLEVAAAEAGLEAGTAAKRSAAAEGLANNSFGRVKGVEEMSENR